MSDRKKHLCRVVVTVTVLCDSEETVNEVAGGDMAVIADLCDTGPCVGTTEISRVDRVYPPRAYGRQKFYRFAAADVIRELSPAPVPPGERYALYRTTNNTYVFVEHLHEKRRAVA